MNSENRNRKKCVGRKVFMWTEKLSEKFVSPLNLRQLFGLSSRISNTWIREDDKSSRPKILPPVVHKNREKYGKHRTSNTESTFGIFNTVVHALHMT